MWETIATFLSGAALALLARVPALTVEGRMVSRLERDTKLLPQIPEGQARDSWLAMVVDQSTAIVEYRREASARSVSLRRAALWAVGALGAIGGLVALAWFVGQSDASPAAAFAGVVASLVAGTSTAQSFLSFRATRAAKEALLRVDHRKEVLDPILEGLTAEVAEMGAEARHLLAIPDGERTDSQTKRLGHLLGRTEQFSRFLELLLATFPEASEVEEALPAAQPPG